jgi:HemY protein
MVRMLRLLIVVVILALTLAWLGQSQGYARVQWLNYELEATASGLMLLALACAVMGWGVIQSLRWVLGYGARSTRKRHTRRNEHGLQSLNQAFLALAQGDTAQAIKHQAQAQKHLPTMALPLLLGAQIANQQRNSPRQIELLQRMMEIPETRALAARSLLAESLARSDLAQAQRYAEQAAEAAPKDASIQSLRVQLLIRQMAFSQAHEMLHRWRTSRQISKAHANSLNALLLTAEAQLMLHRRDYAGSSRVLEQALKLRANWLPAVLLLADAYDAQQQHMLAGKLIEKQWKYAPHPHLAKLHMRMHAAQAPAHYLKTVQSITRSNPNHAESALWLALAAENAAQWAMAKDYAKASIQHQPTREAYTLLAALEQHIAPHLPANSLEFKSLAERTSNLQWHCQQCGGTSPVWNSECGHCHSVDSLSWNQPLDKSIIVLNAA